MDMFTTLRRSGGLDALARKLNVQPPVTALGTSIFLPVIMAGFRGYFEDAGGGAAGLASLGAYLGGIGGGELAVAVMMPNAVDIGPGVTLLHDMVGPDAVVAAKVVHGCIDTGLDKQIAERFLPLLAMLVGGYLAARIDGTGLPGQINDEEIVALLTLDPPVEHRHGPLSD